MASAFKNAGQANPTTDDATANVYTAPSNGTAVLHAVYISNTDKYVSVAAILLTTLILSFCSKLTGLSNIKVLF